MAASWRTVGELLEGAKLSRPVKDALSRVPQSPDFKEPTADVTGYLTAATMAGQRSRSNAHRFLAEMVGDGVSRQAMSRRLMSVSPHEHPEVLALSPGLARVMADAFDIRGQTGGRDDFIGARHVVTAAFTSEDPVVRKEMEPFLATIGNGGLRRRVASNLGAVLSSALEPGEQPGVWSRILEGRGFHPAARVLDAAPPAESGGDPPPEDPPQPSDTTPREPAPWREAIAGFQNDNPWSLPLESVVGGDAVAGALARLVAAKAFQPPLAIGVFGAWGSGKSLLLRRMHAEIEDLEPKHRRAFHDKIVQISFNAWHYVDTDLWASLAGSIFEELDAYARAGSEDAKGLLDQLTTSRRLTLDAARTLVTSRQAARRAEAEVEQAEARLAAEQRGFALSLKGLKATALATTEAGATWLAGDEAARDAVQATYGRSLEEMGSHWAGPEQALDSLRKDHFVWLETVRRFGAWKTVWLLAAVAGVGLALPYLEPWVRLSSSTLADLVSRLQPWATAAGAVLSTAAIRAGALTRRATAARDAVVAATRVYSDARTGALETDTAEVEAKRKSLQAAQDELGRANSSLGAALAAQARADVAFAGDTPGGRLRAFVEARAAADGPYRSRQGLISTIRRDFRDMAALMNPSADAAEIRKHEEDQAAWRAAVSELEVDAGDLLTDAERDRLLAAVGAERPGRPFDRIVLYIDDLDRCPPAKVLEVLQAVHLLLAHSIFVVVVAVDVRWLTGALETEYPALLEADAQASSGKARAFDYLEKIFQLPVWTEAIPARDAADLVRRSFPPAADPAMIAVPPEPDDGEVPEREAGDPPTPAADDDDAPETEVDERTEAGQVEADMDVLQLDPIEIDFLADLAERLEASPRRLVRMANTYRVARVALGEDRNGAILAGGYRGLGLLLGLAAAYPQEFPHIVATLESAGEWPEVSKAWAADWAEKDALLARRLDSIAAYMRNMHPNISDFVRPLIPVARRFSFKG